MRPNLQFPANLVIFTEETLNGDLHFLCSLKKAKFPNFKIILFDFQGNIGKEIVKVEENFVCCDLFLEQTSTRRMYAYVSFF